MKSNAIIIVPDSTPSVVDIPKTDFTRIFVIYQLCMTGDSNPTFFDKDKPTKIQIANMIPL